MAISCLYTLNIERLLFCIYKIRYVILNKNILALAVACCFSSGVLGGEIDSLSLSNSEVFNEVCHIVPTTSLEIPSECVNYVLLEMTKLSNEDRKEITSQVFGLGIVEPFVLVTYSAMTPALTPMSQFDSDLITHLIDSRDNYASKAASSASQIESAYASRVARSASSGPDTSSNPPVSYSWIYNQVIDLNNTYLYRNEKAVLSYELEAFSRLPIYDDLGQDHSQNPIYIRLTLVGGDGVNFNTINYSNSSSVQEVGHPWRPSHQHNIYKYREYLDQVHIHTSWNNIAAGVFDRFPKNNDQDRTGLTYTSSVQFGLGVSIPKLPINKLDFASTKSLTFTNGEYFDYDEEVGLHQHSIRYFNKTYGTQQTPKNGYCEFLGPASGCWRYVNGGPNPPLREFDQRLMDTPYVNGFVPDYSITYQIPRREAQEQGSSLFTVRTQIDGMALLGYESHQIGNRFYSGLANGTGQHYELSEYVDNLQLDINWNSPVFSGVEPSVIKADYGSDDGANCLTVKGNIVRSTSCPQSSTSNEVLFVYTADGQIISFANDKCLDSSNEYLSVMACDQYPDNNQSWSWQDSHGILTSILHTKMYGGSIKILDLENETEAGIPLVITTLEDAILNYPQAGFTTLSGKYRQDAVSSRN